MTATRFERIQSYKFSDEITLAILRRIEEINLSQSVLEHADWVDTEVSLPVFGQCVMVCDGHGDFNFTVWGRACFERFWMPLK